MDKWSEGLPQDAFDQILSLCTLSDRVRMRSVCKSWLSVSNSSSRSRSTDLPWLMMMMVSNPNSKSSEEEGRCFFSLSEKRIYSIKTPETRGWRCCGSFNSGWLMTINRNLDIRLFHPWRKIQLQLPHYSTVYPMGFTRSYARGFQNKAIHKAAMSDDEAVVVIIYEEGRLAFCRIREEKVWTRVLDFSVFYRDIIYNRGHFFVVCFHGEVGVVRINKSNPYVASAIRMEYLTRVAPIPELPRVDCIRHRTYLVADPASETIFTVKRIVRSYFDTETSSPHYIFTTLRFHVYELGLEESTGEYKKNALEVESLGDRVMFLGLNSSMIVMASQFPDFKGNCIYFTDDFLAFLQLNKVRKGCTDMGVFNMEDKTIYPLFPKRAHPPFSPPIWITPTQ